MKISILLPYKENFSKDYSGAVSIFVNGVNKKSKFNKSTKIFGNTMLKNKLSKNYVNIPFKKKIFQSSSKIYIENFIKLEKKRKSDILEIHNRPSYIKYFSYFKNKIVFYFHNDPLSMNGSISKSERLNILYLCDKIVFNSEWTKKRFFIGLSNFYYNSEKITVIRQSTSKAQVDISKKEKLITFIGKLNSSKGYDIFGKAVIKILNEFKDWKVLVFGDEPREKINFVHERFIIKGYQSNDRVLKALKKISIAVACSRWEEPFGRSSLESSSRGCAVIISNRGGLVETITDGIILKKLNHISLYNEIKKLIRDKKKLKALQVNSYNNFYLDDKYTSSLIDKYRNSLLKKNKDLLNKKIRIFHITNFNIRHNGRLFYNTGRRINNGFLKLGHTVQTLSDRDTISQDRKFYDIYGSRSLNNKFLEIIGNYKPNLIVMGHADQISNEILYKTRKFYPSIKMCQWFLDRMDNQEWKINKKRFEKKINYLDANFCTTHPKSIKLLKSKNTYFIPNPVDNTFENKKIFEKKILHYDLFFALSHGVHRGTLKKGKTDKRESFIRNLININNNIKYNLFGLNNKEPVWAENFKKELSECKMALNLSQGHPLKFYSSDRISQLIGNGALTFVDNKTQLNKIFNNNEVVFYRNVNDLSEKINKYKNSEKLRKKIAKAGYIKYHRYMNSKIIAEYIINKTFNIRTNKKYIWENK